MIKLSSTPRLSDLTTSIVALVAAAYLIRRILWWAFTIRLQAIEDYGPVIHEFDPYFNYRAAVYLHENGWTRFFTWFDYMSWYPLGRPVGTTIYPGMQFTAVWIKTYLLPEWSINDVCCYIPAWFGSIASFVTAMIAYECAIPENTSLTIWNVLIHICKGGEIKPVPPASHRSLIPGISSPALECAICTMAIMAVVPAHMMHSVGGGYDNESVATTAMTLTFYCWIRSLRTESSWWIGALAGVAYFYMVATWGGYIFVLNMIGVHATFLVLMGRFSTKVYLAYSLFYFVGTALAVQIPVVGWAPLKSLEQLGPCAVFLSYQGLQLCEVIRWKQKLTRAQAFHLRRQVAGIGLGLLMFICIVLLPKGYFGPLSSRVRGLFVQKTKTGNPLVDSLADYKVPSNHEFYKALHLLCLLAPMGYISIFWNLSDSSSFLLPWASISYFISSRMVRLIFLTAPIGSVLGGIAAGRILSWSLFQLRDALLASFNVEVDGILEATPLTQLAEPGLILPKIKKGARAKHTRRHKQANDTSDITVFSHELSALAKAMASKKGVWVKRSVSMVSLSSAYFVWTSFKHFSLSLSHQLSHPTIIVPTLTTSGEVIKIDDYREAYWWLRDNTPSDSRVIAWWDYGYQITGISHRTTIADGNTWNHEHIALLGKCLTTDLIEGHEIARQLGDYILINAKGIDDDLSKSPQIARIANSVHRDHCPEGDPTCQAFSFIDRQRTPSPMMRRSLIYNLHGLGIKKDIVVNPSLFSPVFSSKHGKVRIYKIENVDTESKKWVANPANRKCDAPGSWFCPGQYPPGLAMILSRKKDFAQVEDFNSQGIDEEYHRMYLEDLQNSMPTPKRIMLSDLAQRSERIPGNNVQLDGNPQDAAASTVISVQSDGSIVTDLSSV